MLRTSNKMLKLTKVENPFETVGSLNDIGDVWVNLNNVAFARDVDQGIAGREHTHLICKGIVRDFTPQTDDRVYTRMYVRETSDQIFRSFALSAYGTTEARDSVRVTELNNVVDNLGPVTIKGHAWIRLDGVILAERAEVGVAGREHTLATVRYSTKTLNGPFQEGGFQAHLYVAETPELIVGYNEGP